MVSKIDVEEKISEYNALAKKYNEIRGKNIRLAKKNSVKGRAAQKRIVDAYNKVARKGREVVRAIELYQG